MPGGAVLIGGGAKAVVLRLEQPVGTAPMILPLPAHLSRETGLAIDEPADVVIGKALRYATGEHALQLKAKAVILVPALRATRGFRLSCREAGQFPELIALVGKVGAKGARKRGYLSCLVIGAPDNVFIAPLLHGQACRANN